MYVKDLIKLLQRVPQDASIQIQDAKDVRIGISATCPITVTDDNTEAYININYVVQLGWDTK